MEWAIFIVLAFLGYMWSRRYEAQKKERQELRTFSHRQRFTDDLGQDWDIDFVDMSLTIEGFSHDPDFRLDEQPKKYAVRRRETGRWQCKITEPSRESAIKELKAEPESKWSGLLDGVRDERLKELERAPRWVAIDDEVAGPLESQYQRFVRHYKES